VKLFRWNKVKYIKVGGASLKVSWSCSLPKESKVNF
jgi:hypothetical protein